MTVPLTADEPPTFQTAPASEPRRRPKAALFRPKTTIPVTMEWFSWRVRNSSFNLPLLWRFRLKWSVLKIPWRVIRSLGVDLSVVLFSWKLSLVLFSGLRDGMKRSGIRLSICGCDKEPPLAIHWLNLREVELRRVRWDSETALRSWQGEGKALLAVLSWVIGVGASRPLLE